MEGGVSGQSTTNFSERRVLHEPALYRLCESQGEIDEVDITSLKTREDLRLRESAVVCVCVIMLIHLTL